MSTGTICLSSIGFSADLVYVNRDICKVIYVN